MKGFERMKEMKKALKIGLFGLLAHIYASTALAATGTSARPRGYGAVGCAHSGGDGGDLLFFDVGDEYAC